MFFCTKEYPILWLWSEVSLGRSKFEVEYRLISMFIAIVPWNSPAPQTRHLIHAYPWSGFPTYLVQLNGPFQWITRLKTLRQKRQQASSVIRVVSLAFTRHLTLDTMHDAVSCHHVCYQPENYLVVRSGIPVGMSSNALGLLQTPLHMASWL